MRVQQPDPNDIGYFSSNPIEGSSNFWKKAGDEKTTDIPGFSPSKSNAPGYFPTYALYGYQYASKFVRKADYIRLRDLVVTYNIKSEGLRKMGLLQPQIRLQAQNVFRYTFSGNDIDPDAIDRISGIRTLPQQPLYSLSLFCKF
jgi:hypothetical protein